MSVFDYSTLRKCGKNVRIAPTVFFRNPQLVSIGNHVAIDGFCHFTTALEIGDYVHIAAFCSIIGGGDAKCTIKDFSGLATGCRLVCASDDFLGSGLTGPTVPPKYRAKIQYGPITVEKFCIIGTNVVVHPGVTIGEGSAVGSCSLITRDLEPWHVYTGIPAKARAPRKKERMLELEAQLRAELG